MMAPPSTPNHSHYIRLSVRIETHQTCSLTPEADPCLTDVTHNFAIDFPEAWTNAQSGSVYINRSEVAMMSIREGGSQSLWWPGEGCSVWPDLECRNYFRWDAQPDREISDKSRTGTLFLVVHTARNKSPLSSSLKSMTFRQIGSASCKMGLDEPSNEKDYSFTIDFSNSHGKYFNTTSTNRTH